MSFPFDIQGQIDAVTREVDTLQNVVGGPLGYRLRRIILVNFWLYGLQVFEIPHGRLLLAGNNASGKSTVLTAALPLALEGNLRPERLDTFGGKHKHVDYYILGDEASPTSFTYQKRTSYIALEFEWCLSTEMLEAKALNLEPFLSLQEVQQDKPRYLTIGISFYGNETATPRIQPLYFLITDSSRLLKEIQLISVGNDNQKRTYSQHDFKESLKGHGIICEKQEHYAREVSKHLFGFEDMKQFHKLIELLLVIRRPNPSDKLTVTAVQQHLSDALPDIPDDSAKEAVETIGEIEHLQDQVVQLEQEYQAVSELHRALQSVALSKARVAAFYATMSQQMVERLDTQVAHLYHELADLETQQQQSRHIYAELHEERERVSGKITAIDMGEWAKATQQLIEAQNQLTFAYEQAERQEKNLDRAQARRRHCEQKIALQTNNFQERLDTTKQKIRDLVVRIEEKALWYELAKQFQKGLEQIGQVESGESDTTELLQEIARLTSLETGQRLQWLQNLDQLHQEKQDLERTIEHAQQEEEQHVRELSRLFAQFQEELSNFYTLSRQIELTLERILMNADNIAVEIAPYAIEQDDTQNQEESVVFENIEGVQTYVEQCKTQLQQHKNYIESIVHVRGQTLHKWKQELDDLRLVKGQKHEELQAKEQEYALKKMQPEILPERPAHREDARKKLAEQHIVAFPLYSLIDLAPACEVEEGGAIEHMLEDAGLLDALVILDTNVAAADVLLQTEALSDYRLDSGRLKQMATFVVGENPNTVAGRWLQFDSAVRETLLTTYEQWEEAVNTLIPLIEALFTQPMSHTNSIIQPMMDSSSAGKSWRHGLLTGQSYKGNVQFIGKTMRQRARQQELAALALEITMLQSELAERAQHLAQREARFEKFSTEQEEIRTLLDRKGLSVALQILQNTSIALGTAYKKHKETQEQTRKKHQEHNRLVMNIVERSGPIVVFVHEHEKVRRALQETYKLGPEAQSLQQEIQALLYLSNEIQEMQSTLQDVILDQNENQKTYDDLQDQHVRYKSLVGELQDIVDSPEAKNLAQKLGELRTRAEQVSEEILAVAQTMSVFTERKNTLVNNMTQKEADLRTGQMEMRQRQAAFKEILSVYPVPELQQARALVDEGTYTQAVQPLQIDVASLERLQKAQLEALSTLHAAHQTHMNLLHEYGPELDQNIPLITFSHANGAMPFELSDVLENDSRKLQDLLKDKEIKLFESFLLRRMTEVIHRHIREAKVWVEKMNNSLLTMSTVKDRYELEWQAKPRLDEVRLGMYLARQQKLFSMPPMKLSEEERELLRTAFKQEINALWHMPGERSGGMNFEQRLHAVFDYRQWFQFHIYVTPNGGQRSLLTNKALGARSGAERLFAVLVPLLAAVAALYSRAAPGAPHLLALDEAFDRADADNMKQLIEYLAAQDFQWIMTGPQLNISGTQVPVGVRYQMLHEKGKMVATAMPKIWKSNRKENM